MLQSALCLFPLRFPRQSHLSAYGKAYTPRFLYGCGYAYEDFPPSPYSGHEFHFSVQFAGSCDAIVSRSITLSHACCVGAVNSSCASSFLILTEESLRFLLRPRLRKSQYSSSFPSVKKQMYMVRHPMPYYFYTFVFAQCSNYLLKVCSILSVDCLPTIFGNEHYAVLAHPCDMC